jgi:hypothetical protein
VALQFCQDMIVALWYKQVADAQCT